eukprot:1068310-Rhodomonas_salina.5
MLHCMIVVQGRGDAVCGVLTSVPALGQGSAEGQLDREVQRPTQDAQRGRQPPQVASIHQQVSPGTLSRYPSSASWRYLPG